MQHTRRMLYMRPLHRRSLSLLVLCLLAVGVETSRAGDPQAALPKVRVDFDGQRMWLAHAASDDALTLMEFIPDGQTLDNWKSLAAIHTSTQGRIGPRKRADALVAQIKQTHPEAPVASLDSPDLRQSVVSFALWSAGEPFVEFTVFAFGTGSDDTEVGLQYSVRVKSTPEVFLQRELNPLRDRLVKMILREGLSVSDDGDLTTMRLAVSPAEQAICDTIVKDNIAGVGAVLKQPEDRSAVVLFVASAVAFDTNRLEDSAFLFYAGQLRLRFDEQCFPPKTADGHNPIQVIRGYSLELGAKINPAVMKEPEIFSNALARVARWRPRAPSTYSPGYEFDQRLTEEAAGLAAEANRVEFLKRMGDFATLLSDKDYFLAIQIVKGLRVHGDDRLPTKEEYEAAVKTVSRIEEQRGIEGFGTN